MEYAVLDGGAVVATRQIADWNTYPANRKAANDEKGDGYPVLRPIEQVTPPFDAVTQIKTGPEYVILPDKVQRVWTVTDRTGDDLKNSLKAHAASKRWEQEQGGIVAEGMSVPTDDRAKTLLMGAAGALANEDTAPLVVGLVAATLTGAQFKAIYAAIVAHSQACFATQASVYADIESGVITTPAQINTAFGG